MTVLWLVTTLIHVLDLIMMVPIAGYSAQGQQVRMESVFMTQFHKIQLS
jgi:hypothetical protein